MSLATDLSISLPDNLPAIMGSPERLDDTLQRIADLARAHQPDLSTAAGRSRIASVAHAVARSKTALDDAGKALTSDLRDKINVVDAERRRMRDFLDALKVEVRAPLTAWEAAEDARVEALKSRLGLFDRPAVDGTSASLSRLAAEIEAIAIDDTWQEFTAAAGKAKDEALRRLRSDLATAQAAEEAARREELRLAEERAELERLRAEKAAREKADREAAEARAAADRQAAAEKAEAERIARIEREKAVAMERAAREAKEAAERAAAERVAAAEKSAREAAEAAQAAKEREARAIEAERQRAAEEHRREEAARARREQDEQLRAKARLEIAAAAFSIISSAPNHEAAAASIADAILGGVFPRVEVRI